MEVGQGGGAGRGVVAAEGEDMECRKVFSPLFRGNYTRR